MQNRFIDVVRDEQACLLGIKRWTECKDKMIERKKEGIWNEMTKSETNRRKGRMAKGQEGDKRGCCQWKYFEYLCLDC